MCPPGGATGPSGTYAITGATSALPRARATCAESARTRALCLPSAMCGPFCSVPPVGTMIVVLPERTRSRTSVQVRSSRNTLSGACAGTRAAHARATHSAAAVAADRMGINCAGVRGTSSPDASNDKPIRRRRPVFGRLRALGAGRTAAPIGPGGLLERVDEEPAQELRLEPGALGRHDLAGVGDGHELLHRRRKQGDGERGLARVDPRLELALAPDAAHEVDARVRPLIADAQDGSQH